MEGGLQQNEVLGHILAERYEQLSVLLAQLSIKRLELLCALFHYLLLFCGESVFGSLVDDRAYRVANHGSEDWNRYDGLSYGGREGAHGSIKADDFRALDELHLSDLLVSETVRLISDAEGGGAEGACDGSRCRGVIRQGIYRRSSDTALREATARSFGNILPVSCVNSRIDFPSRIFCAVSVTNVPAPSMTADANVT